MAVSEDSLIVPKGGRPMLYGERTSPVSSCLPVSYHDRLCKLATLYDMSVSAISAKILMRAIDRAIDE